MIDTEQVPTDQSMQAASASASNDAAPNSGEDWHELKDLDVRTAKFPARAKLNGEGIVIFRTKSGYRGTQRACPHMQATMLNAVLTANESMVRCPLHVFTFRLSDGRGVNCPGYKVKIFEVKEEAGVLFGRAV